MFRYLLITIGLILTWTLSYGQASDTLVIKGFAVEGNKKTKEWLIIRESGHRVGEKFLVSEIENIAADIQTNVNNLQLFATVTVLPISLPDAEVLFLITVTERWYFYPVPVIQLAEPNFNVWWRNRRDSRTNYGLKLRQYNFRGRNERLALTLKFGWTREFRVGYSSPYLIKGKNWGFDINARYKENQEVNTGTIGNERIFFEGEENDSKVEQLYNVGIGYRPSIFQDHRFTIGYENVEVSDSLHLRFPDYLHGSRRHLEQMKLTYSYNYTRVDRKGYPLEGKALSAHLQKSGLGVFKNSADILDLVISGKRYFKLGDRWSIQHNISAKTTFYQRLPYHLQRGLGYGNNSVRSYEYYIFDGQDYALSRNNLNFKLLQNKSFKFLDAFERVFPDVNFAVHTNLIFDLGYVQDDLYGDLNPLSNELILGTGLGLDVVSNYDYVIRMEYTINKESEHGFYLHYRKSI